MSSLRILHLEDSLLDAELVRAHLTEGGIPAEVTRVETRDAFAAALRQSWNLILADYSLPAFDGLEALAMARAEAPETPVILVTGHMGEERAVETLKSGATDFVLKQGLSRLIPAVRRALHEASERRQRLGAEAALRASEEQYRLTAEALSAKQTKLSRVIREYARSNGELRQFASIIAHDLRQPLHSISLYLHALQKVCKAKLIHEIDELVNSAVTVINRMSELMTDTLEYSRIGGSGIAFAAFPLERAVQQACTHLAAAIRASKATVQIEPLPEVVGNEALLTQLFQNLIDNAIKYRGDQPPTIHISAARGEHGYEISVADNGPGIDAADSSKLFNLFQRPARHSEYPGTGVGLSLCKLIAERHGGRIWFTSEAGLGTVFHIALPFTSPDPPLTEAELAE